MMTRLMKRIVILVLVTVAVIFMTFTYSMQEKRYSDLIFKMSDIKSRTIIKDENGNLLPSQDTDTVKFTSNEAPNHKGKTKVYRYNGMDLERLHDFCTWSLPMDCASLKTPGGQMTIYIHDVEDDPGLSGVLKKTGIRDTDNVAILIKELEKYPEAGFFDFGSHIGVYGLSVAHTLGRDVVFIDPMIENTARLCKSIQLNNLTDKMTIVYNAISNEKTKVNFKRPYHHIGATKVVKSPNPDETSCDTTEHYSVTLDEILPVVPFKKAVMKLDVEMSEYLALQGGQKFIQEIDVRSILIEWYNIVTTPHAKPLVDMLEDLKYVPYIPYVNGLHKRVKYEDYKSWTRYRQLLDVLWIKEE